MFKKILFNIFVLCVLCFVFFAQGANAGFGATPPYIKNDYLRRGEQYAYKIYLTRSEANEELRGEVSLDIPEVAAWFSVEPGTEFTVPKGVQQFPITVRIHVPGNVKLETYVGVIRLKANPAHADGGSIDVALGARVDIEVTVTDKEIVDFSVRKVDVLPAEESREFLWMEFPGKITAAIKIENTGNTKTRPQEIRLAVYDTLGKTLLASVQNTNRIAKVNPSEIATITAEFPVHLKIGDYKAIVRLPKKDGTFTESDAHLEIRSQGSVEGYGGYGILGLSAGDKIILFAIVLSGLMAAGWIRAKIVTR